MIAEFLLVKEVSFELELIPSFIFFNYILFYFIFLYFGFWGVGRWQLVNYILFICGLG